MSEQDGEIDGLHYVAGFMVGTIFEDVAIQFVDAGDRCEKCRALLLAGEGYPIVRGDAMRRGRGPFCVPCAVKLGTIRAFRPGSVDHVLFDAIHQENSLPLRPYERSGGGGDGTSSTGEAVEHQAEPRQGP